jgi:cell wall-associated NlpC family hydrolase
MASYSCIYVVTNKDRKEKSIDTAQQKDSSGYYSDTSKGAAFIPSDTIESIYNGKDIDTKNISPKEVVGYAQTLIGVPYKYASTDPNIGFDCSGFITYVFHHFGIAVPRSSIDFTNVGTPVSVEKAKPGDLILFTGTDSTERFVGHMGIIVSNTDTAKFIHATSGKAYGVTITPLNNYYKGRYVKTIRIFK